MSTRSFFGVEPVRYVGPDAGPSLGYRYYDKDRVVRGKRMEDHLRLAVCYWHSFAGDGSDVFGGGTFQRPWQQTHNPVEGALQKATAAFDFFQTLGTRYFCFHDRDVAPEASTPAGVER